MPPLLFPPRHLLLQSHSALVQLDLPCYTVGPLPELAHTVSVRAALRAGPRPRLIHQGLAERGVLEGGPRAYWPGVHGAVHAGVKSVKVWGAGGRQQVLGEGVAEGDVLERRP